MATVQPQKGPYISSPDTIERVMWQVCASLVPACVAAFVFFGPYALYLMLAAAFSALVFEIPFRRSQFSLSHPFGDGSAFATGLLLGLTLAPASAWWVPILGGFLAIVVGKQLFGGLGNNIFNPALVARAILLAAYPLQLTSWVKPLEWTSSLDAVTSATPLAQGASDYWQLFIGNVSGSIGETSALALLAGALYLYHKGYIEWRIPISFLGAAIATAILLNVDPLFTILSGGLMFGALFMATDMVTSPVSFRGRVLFGTGCGVLTVFLRQYTYFPETVTFAILFMNGTAFLIDTLLRGPKFGEVDKQTRPFFSVEGLIGATILFVILGSGSVHLTEYLRETYGTRPHAISATDGSYTGRGDGFYGPIDVRVQVENGEITSITVESHSDTPGVANPAFAQMIDTIIENQHLALDGVAGATASSRGLLAAVEKALAEPPTADDPGVQDAIDEKPLFGTGEGFYGPIQVHVFVDPDDIITKIEVTEHADTAGIANPAFETLIEKVISSQSLDVDTISGATASSQGLIDAVGDALGIEPTTTPEVDSYTSATDDWVPEPAGETFTGTAQGFYGPITVQVTVADDETITAISVQAHEDTAFLADPAFEQLIQAILESQNLDVDTISGATASSWGLINAVKDALGLEHDGPEYDSQTGAS